MSWFQELAGKAENILTQIDENAKNVLQTNGSGDVVKEAQLIEVKTIHTTQPIPRIPSTKALSLIGTKSTPKKRTQKNEDDTSVRSFSSRSSVHEGSVIEVETASSVFEVEKPSFQFSSTVPIDKELAATKILLAEIKAERDELKSELEIVTDQLKNNDVLNRIHDLEVMCQSLIQEKDELNKKYRFCEQSNEKYIKSISELELTVLKHHQNEMNLKEKLEIAKIETDQATNELQLYRSRAQSTLQLKEKMIEKLRQSSSICSDHDSIGDSNKKDEQLLSIELEQMKNEKSHLTVEIQTLSEKLEQSKLFLTSLEGKYNQINQDLEEKLHKIQSNANDDRVKRLQLEEDFRTQNQELIEVKENLIKQREIYSINLHERDSEIEKLRGKIYNNPINLSNDIEERLHSLTQSLVQKQTALESITAEKNALKIQLEKMELFRQQSTTIDIPSSQSRSQRLITGQNSRFLVTSSNETDDVKSQFPTLMNEHPFDNNMTRRVKRAYTSIDTLGIRVGVIMRRYPLARIFVIFYVAILHLWVMFVLFSSTPNQ